MMEVPVMTRRFVSLAALVLIVQPALGLLSTPSFASKRTPATKPKIFAQRLVEEVLAKHSDVTSVELAIQSPEGCSTIAASNPKDIGEKCDKDELDPMRTGEPSVEKESDGFDVTMPLHDTSGQIIGTIGIDFKAAPGQQRSSVVQKAKKIMQEAEAQIPRKEKLLEPFD
jgi:hypothetical protein